MIDAIHNDAAWFNLPPAALEPPYSAADIRRTRLSVEADQAEHWCAPPYTDSELETKLEYARYTNMGRPLKYHPHGSVLFVTMSVEEGLFLLSNPLCHLIITSCLARAQSLYPVRISHAIAEGTHIHLILVVENPADVHQFIGYFKAESAHRFNRVLGRQKRTVWCEGYDSPVVLTMVRSMVAIAYLYANPAKDNLEDTIDNYPAFSTWKMFNKGEHLKRWKAAPRNFFRALPEDSHNLRGYSKDAQRILSDSKGSHEFKIEPNAWLEAFGIVKTEDQDQINALLFERIKTLEARARKKRTKQGKRVMGRERLLAQPIDTLYRPKRSGRRMWALSESRAKRVEFINFLKKLITEARRVRDRWRLGDFTERYPLGLFPPAMTKLGEPISAM